MIDFRKWLGRSTEEVPSEPRYRIEALLGGIDVQATSSVDSAGKVQERIRQHLDGHVDAFSYQVTDTLGGSSITVQDPGDPALGQFLETAA